MYVSIRQFWSSKEKEESSLLLIFCLFLGIDIINTNGVGEMIIVWTIIGAILPWIIHSLGITRDIAVLAASLFDIVDGKTKVPLRETSMEKLQNDSWFIECITSYPGSYWAFVIIR